MKSLQNALVQAELVWNLKCLFDFVRLEADIRYFRELLLQKVYHSEYLKVLLEHQLCSMRFLKSVSEMYPAPTTAAIVVDGESFLVLQASLPKPTHRWAIGSSVRARFIATFKVKLLS